MFLLLVGDIWKVGIWRIKSPEVKENGFRKQKVNKDFTSPCVADEPQVHPYIFFRLIIGVLCGGTERKQYPPYHIPMNIYQCPNGKIC